MTNQIKSGGEHWSRQGIVARIISAMVEASGKVQAVPAGRAADDILALLAPALSRTPAKAGEDGGERARIVAWLRDDAGRTRDDLSRLHAARKLTIGQTAEWEALIALKVGIADAIERGEHLSSIEEPRGE